MVSSTLYKDDLRINTIILELFLDVRFLPTPILSVQGHEK
jgi:hypothetical protein